MNRSILAGVAIGGALVLLWLLWPDSALPIDGDGLPGDGSAVHSGDPASVLPTETEKRLEGATAQACEVLPVLSSSPTEVGKGKPREEGKPLDADWASLPRTSQALPNLVAGATGMSMTAKHLFRNRHLNPRDTYIPKEVRDPFKIVLADLREKLNASWQARMKVYNTEFGQTVESGAARDIGPASPVEVTLKDGTKQKGYRGSSRAMKKAGVDMVRVVDGRMIAASRSEMPASRPALDHERFLESEIAATLTIWFVNVGALSDAEAKELLRPLLDRRLDLHSSVISRRRWLGVGSLGSCRELGSPGTGGWPVRSDEVGVRRKTRTA